MNQMIKAIYEFTEDTIKELIKKEKKGFSKEQIKKAWDFFIARGWRGCPVEEFIEAIPIVYKSKKKELTFDDNQLIAMARELDVMKGLDVTDDKIKEALEKLRKIATWNYEKNDIDRIIGMEYIMEKQHERRGERRRSSESPFPVFREFLENIGKPPPPAPPSFVHAKDTSFIQKINFDSWKEASPTDSPRSSRAETRTDSAARRALSEPKRWPSVYIPRPHLRQTSNPSNSDEPGPSSSTAEANQKPFQYEPSPSHQNTSNPSTLTVAGSSRGPPTLTVSGSSRGPPTLTVPGASRGQSTLTAPRPFGGPSTLPVPKASASPSSSVIVVGPRTGGRTRAALRGNIRNRTQSQGPTRIE